MTVETMDRVIYISHSRDSCLNGKSGKRADESRAKLEENLQAKHCALSAEESTSN